MQKVLLKNKMKKEYCVCGHLEEKHFNAGLNGPCIECNCQKYQKAVPNPASDCALEETISLVFNVREYCREIEDLKTKIEKNKKEIIKNIEHLRKTGYDISKIEWRILE